MPNNKDLLLAAEDLLRSTASYSSAEIEAARSKLKRQVQALQDRHRRGGPLDTERYAAMAHTTQRYVSEHTWQSVAIVAILGIAVGACLYENRRSRNIRARPRSFIQRSLQRITR